ncbi:hypothetical protein ON010_g11686 [Phytophthora cinnamomi]|nr:hypothetical protein ON010_g11686 [Phytophthora cinnamomi]
MPKASDLAGNAASIQFVQVVHDVDNLDATQQLDPRAALERRQEAVEWNGSDDIEDHSLLLVHAAQILVVKLHRGRRFLYVPVEPNVDDKSNLTLQPDRFRYGCSNCCTIQRVHSKLVGYHYSNVHGTTHDKSHPKKMEVALHRNTFN